MKSESVGRVFIHRRSVVKRGGCFQRRLFVSMLVRTISTSEQLNVKRSNLAVRYVVKISLEFEGQGQRAEVKVTRDKKEQELIRR